MTELNLDVDVPEKVADVLRDAAQRFYETTGELQAAWSDPQCGKVWEDLGKILLRAASQCDKAIANRLG